jgi:hypothetical protein
MSKLTEKLPAAELWSRPFEAVNRSTTSPESSA